mgnify:FL=1
MKSIIYVLYGLYQYIIVWPIMVVLTLFTAVFTMLFVPFRNAEFVHKVQQFWSRSFYRLMFLPVTVEGLEHIQQGQSYVFVSNHQSMFDVWLIYGWLPVIFKWLMKAELRKVPFVGTAGKAAGHIFVDRRNPKAAMESMEEVKKQLKDGVCTVIFPEGTRTKDGQVGRFKRGAFQIALDLQLPVVPISLSGCYNVLPKGKPFVYRRPVRMYVGEPIDITQFENNNDAIEFVRSKVIENITQ